MSETTSSDLIKIDSVLPTQCYELEIYLTIDYVKDEYKYCPDKEMQMFMLPTMTRKVMVGGMDANDIIDMFGEKNIKSITKCSSPLLIKK